MLSEAFYQQSTLDLAQALLGKRLVRIHQGQRLSGRIVEVEAYHQDNDPAAHSFRGPTPRNQIMFGPPGHLYVYFIYGMHYCMNVVSEAEGIGAAVLIRALEPEEGVELMQERRGPKIKPRDLTNGPARACQALSINRDQDGVNLRSETLFLEQGPPPAQIAVSTRVGITKAVELPWRFYDAGSAHVSKGKPSG